MLGLDTYSLRSFRSNVFQLLDYAAAHKITTVQAFINNFESSEATYLNKAKSHATWRFCN